MVNDELFLINFTRLSFKNKLITRIIKAIMFNLLVCRNLLDRDFMPEPKSGLGIS